MSTEAESAGLAWQTGVWNRIAATYQREIDARFVPVVDGVLQRATLGPGMHAVDLGTGTGSVALGAAMLVAPGGDVVAIDISPEMLAVARARVAGLGVGKVELRLGRAEEMPLDSGSCDVLLASLSLMYALDREEAAREIARVLRPGGRCVASVWAGPDRCDIVRFQQLAGSFAPAPPVPGVGPGALADPRPFLDQLAAAGIVARVESETLGFEFPDFASAWDVLAGVTVANLSPERRQEAQGAVLAAMWPHGDGPRHFRNETLFIVGEKWSP